MTRQPGGLARETSTITTTDGAGGSLCLDADAMTPALQLFRCINDDDDQQYGWVGGYGLIIDLWTGFDNCVGVAGPECAPPQGVHPVVPPPPPPAHGCNGVKGSPSTWLSPKYHLNDGGQGQSDPSGPLAINGTWFVFPDQARACGPDNQDMGAVYTSTDLVRWTRRPTNIRFSETGGVAVTSDGIAFTFGGSPSWANVAADPWLSNWSPLVLTGLNPHIAGRNGEQPLTRGDSPHSGLFRVGDPSQPFLYNGSWHLVLGAGRNGTAESPTPIQGELRLVRGINRSITAWEYVATIYSSNQTEGLWAEQLSNMFECPDFFPFGRNGKWMFITSQIFQVCIIGI